MGFADDMRVATAATWEAAVGHRFVDELWAGTVDDAVLARYLAQDALFLDRFVALLGEAVASADRTAPRLAIARQLGLVAGDENDYFDRALARLGATAPTDPLPATRGFLDLMDEARRSTSYGDALTVLLVAEWLYLDWASHPGAAPDDWLHREWIDLHRGPAFTAWVDLLRSETDRVAGDADRTTRERMTELFTRAVDLELVFFDAAYAAAG
ncbi:thiaminase/transcriptional activator TenA [Actinomycetospora succinea]|uniref:Aminopyrimidine aminohydrolase n=1 Tax=Actinomycetospora succinea TaxID=663603 RepID=A0A4R6VIC3_9PSEU|nr:TenA family protein [Actinomycetospora succinea]TDQ61096.1 thiaminase/transcriptional activator TenA [Actinomycetospora succinea]